MRAGSPSELFIKLNVLLGPKVPTVIDQLVLESEKVPDEPPTKQARKKGEGHEGRRTKQASNKIETK